MLEAPGADGPTGRNSSRRVPDFLRQIIITVFFGAVFAIALQVSVQNYVVEGISMQPTVLSGDRVLVDRLAYKVGSPRRGDIVVFKFPYSDQNLIKRVIALPGDTVSITAGQAGGPGQLRINGVVVREPYLRYTENYDYGPVRVPQDQYFVLGDNRPVSWDSHDWGFLPTRYLFGRVMVTYWPVADFHLYGF